MMNNRRNVQPSDASAFDAIVIGSGIGGMTAAGLLSGVAGKRVLVLEKHTELGGLTHVFRRDGASWDVGLHYVGQLEPGSQARDYFNYLSTGRLQWNRMPDEFERFVYPGLDFAQPSDPQRFEERLIARFPDEARAIRRYFRDVRAAVRWTMLGFMRNMVPRPVAPLLRFLERVTGANAKRTTADYLNRHFRSPLLRALLVSQWGDYGLPPSQSAFAIHAQIVTHYLRGAWFPEGGAARIARTFEKGIEQAGGAMQVGQDVVEILMQENRAVGVRVIDRRGSERIEAVYRAPIIISDIGAASTYRHLLPTDGEIGAKTAELRELIARLERGLSAVTLYLRLKAPVTTIGLRGENFWVNTDTEHNDLAAQQRGLIAGRPTRLYASFPSIKGGDNRFHTAEIIGFVDQSAFNAWRDKPKGSRGADYLALKGRISSGLLALAETAMPGLTALVEYAELSTPLTVEHYTSHAGGCLYGLSATPERYRSGLLQSRTPVAGLYLSGADAGCLGILGAMTGGIGAACQALGPKGFALIQATVKKGPLQHAGTPELPNHKRMATLVDKRQLTATIWHLAFKLDDSLDHFAPGQFARVQVAEFEWRDYSIAKLADRTVEFLISTRTGGYGSRYVIAANRGDRTIIELPLGQYALTRSGRRAVFVATGTGLAPFVPMFVQLAGDGSLDRAQLLFGCKTPAEDITPEIRPLPAAVTRCFSRADPAAGGFDGRVTSALASREFVVEDSDFYLCGSAAMVADCTAILSGKGVQHIFTEIY